MVLFTDRVEAGRRLALQLDYLRGQDIVVLGIPRGGVPVAYEVAASLDVPLDVIVVRKLGVPFQPEFAMGAIGEGGEQLIDESTVALTGVTDAEVSAVEARERVNLDARVERLRPGRDRIPLDGKTVVIVDDGVATGATARVACDVARRFGAATVILAVPVIAASTLAEMTGADDIVYLAAPETFWAVGQFYTDFSATTDDEVARLLDEAARRLTGPSGAGDSDLEAGVDDEVEIPVDTVPLNGHLHLPASPTGVVLFAHGSGSSRHSPRNQYVADVLFEAGLGILLFDLLTPEEELDRENVFDIELLGRRLVAVTGWLTDRSDTAGCRIGYFGASTGAAAALWAAGDAETHTAAVVSRGGRPDLAGTRLPLVTAPTLLIVGGADITVLEGNREAQKHLRCENRLAVIPGATHLFEEPGALGAAAELAADWFARHLVPPNTAEPA
ncbi:phosphoribosyltransferase [Cryobacterium sp. TMB3-1-2]|uniref:phosphoribosyltransferase n=1 Tax=Cryobacterium sp. TMB3-12 TaxID=1259210 RepID=UPI00106AB99F|nr:MULTISPECIES: phosphoribosyltransferase [unclassified Cryobacterium]TFC51132.1 phosphoribosyltransferase [Cryobacterium sp. TMB3-1-2]TFC74478.1 phosphoribosyltransferase [Cryobacterium sp. TMB3-15]TFC79991.1 phosphoribosyltransferase [Cryobacterium sp. TMB3-10]TFD41892.1 phosphoribosyltransferase [Cryobacterium sp. TMB3-12]